MNTPLSRIRFVLPWLAAASLAAQAPPAPTAPSVRVGSGAGLQSLDGELTGIGQHYKVVFERGAVVFTPVFGRAAKKTCPVRLALLGCGRGNAVEPVPAAAPVQAGLCAEYRHGAMIERYEVRPEGVAQSFEFQARPPGNGDLTVRLRLDTGLRVEPAGDGLRFSLPGIGSFGMSGVTGIDGKGARCRGSLRLVDGVLELTLPEHFVASAQLPIVLDPLFGAVFNISALSSDDEAPRTAYVLGSDLWLVVWTRINSATDSDILGQRIGITGLPVGGPFGIDTRPGLNDSASVASIRNRDGFIVTYSRSDDVLGRGVNAATGAVSLSATFAGGPDIQRYGDVGGEATTADDDGVLVWVDYTTNSIHSLEVGLNADFTVAARGPARVVFHDLTNLVCDFPRISRCGGPVRRYGMTCTLEHNSANRDPLFFVLDDTGAPLTAPFTVAAGTTSDYVATCDGDGTNWIVAWERLVGTATAVQAVSLSYSGIGPALPYTTSAAVTLANSGRLPAVTWLGSTCLVSWLERTATTALCRVVARDLLRCNECEDLRTLAGTFDLDFTAFGAGTVSGGNPLEAELALLVFETTQSTTNNGDVQAQLWDAHDGFLLDRGGGCGAGGQATAPCFIPGNLNFALHLRGARPSSPAALVLATERIDLPCGPCRLVPDPFSGVVIFRTTDVRGDADLPVPVPFGLAMNVFFHTQWLVVGGTPGCAALGVSLSPGQTITIDF